MVILLYCEIGTGKEYLNNRGYVVDKIKQTFGNPAYLIRNKYGNVEYRNHSCESNWELRCNNS